MSTLVPGQNTAWPHADLQVLAPEVDVVVFALGVDDRVLDPDALLRAVGGVRLHLPVVPAKAERLLVLGVGTTGAVDVTLADAAGAVVATAPVNETGLVALVEVYRRAGAWKVRAVARAYAGGAADVQRLHGVRVDGAGLDGTSGPAQAPVAPAYPPPRDAVPTPPVAPPPAPPAVPRPTPRPAARPAAAPTHALPKAPGVGESSEPGAPVSHDRAIQLVGMILEDAARSGASYASSVAYAQTALEDEEGAIVADPALRVSAEGDRARAAARARHDDLVRRAREAHLRDLAQLSAEVADVERSLPPAMQRWEVARPAGPGEDPPTALRAGDITLAHLADVPGVDFRLPMVWRVPSRPLLVSVEEGGDDAATRIALLLALRGAASVARHRPRLVVTDLGGRRGDLGLPPGLVPATLTSAPAATRLLSDLDRRSDLIEVARSNGALDALDPDMLRPVVLLLTDVPTAWEAEALPLLDRLVSRRAPGLQVVLTGPDRPPRVGSPAEQRLLEAVWSSSLRLPSGPGGQLADAFANVAWTFLPDLGPTDVAVLQRFLAQAAPFEGWRDGIVPSPQ